MNHLDLNPATCSRGELYDAYQDQIHRTGQMLDEVMQLCRRQRALEAFITAVVERHLERNCCRLGECSPAWDRKSGRYVHTAPCSLAGGEQLLRETVRTRTHYGIHAPHVRPSDAEDIFGLQGHASIETEGEEKHPPRPRLLMARRPAV